MSPAPLILISPSTQRHGAEFYDYSLSLSDAYPQAIEVAGGVPWIMSCTPSPSLVAESVRQCAGVLLTGGDDLQPKLYASRLAARLRKTVHAADARRDLAELLLIREIFRQRKPLLGICRGHQILNVALGGTLIVDIGQQVPEALQHTRTDLKDQVVHDITLTPDSLMGRIFGRSSLGVNSTHHQAVGRLAQPLQATARSVDGIIEALELRAGDRHAVPFLLSVQFHPERLIRRHKEFLVLFQSFIEACAKVRPRTL